MDNTLLRRFVGLQALRLHLEELAKEVKAAEQAASLAVSLGFTSEGTQNQQLRVAEIMDVITEEVAKLSEVMRYGGEVFLPPPSKPLTIYLREVLHVSYLQPRPDVATVLTRDPLTDFLVKPDFNAQSLTSFLKEYNSKHGTDQTVGKCVLPPSLQGVINAEPHYEATIRGLKTRKASGEE